VLDPSLAGSTWAGLALLATGYGLRFWGMAHLRRSGLTNLVGTRVPQNGYSVTGPYRYLRHPLYWGSAISICGVGLVAFGWPGLALVYPAVPYFVERAMYESEVRSQVEANA
jgi:protein-S-isoprenylcysteine O-methyltransferase Ste14